MQLRIKSKLDFLKRTDLRVYEGHPNELIHKLRQEIGIDLLYLKIYCSRRLKDRKNFAMMEAKFKQTLEDIQRMETLLGDIIQIEEEIKHIQKMQAEEESLPPGRKSHPESGSLNCLSFQIKGGEQQPGEGINPNQLIGLNQESSQAIGNSFRRRFRKNTTFKSSTDPNLIPIVQSSLQALATFPLTFYINQHLLSSLQLLFYSSIYHRYAVGTAYSQPSSYSDQSSSKNSSQANSKAGYNRPLLDDPVCINGLTYSENRSKAYVYIKKALQKGLQLVEQSTDPSFTSFLLQTRLLYSRYLFEDYIVENPIPRSFHSKEKKEESEDDDDDDEKDLLNEPSPRSPKSVIKLIKRLMSDNLKDAAIESVLRDLQGTCRKSFSPSPQEVPADFSPAQAKKPTSPAYKTMRLMKLTVCSLLYLENAYCKEGQFIKAIESLKLVDGLLRDIFPSGDHFAQSMNVFLSEEIPVLQAFVDEYDEIIETIKKTDKFGLTYEDRRFDDPKIEKEFQERIKQPSTYLFKEDDLYPDKNLDEEAFLPTKIQYYLMKKREEKQDMEGSLVGANRETPFKFKIRSSSKSNLENQKGNKEESTMPFSPRLESAYYKNSRYKTQPAYSESKSFKEHSLRLDTTTGDTRNESIRGISGQQSAHSGLENKKPGGLGQSPRHQIVPPLKLDGCGRKSSRLSTSLKKSASSRGALTGRSTGPKGSNSYRPEKPVFSQIYSPKLVSTTSCNI